MLALIERACEMVGPTRLWINPDCGLKTRGVAGTRAALAIMAHAARLMRERFTARRPKDVAV